MQLVLDANVLFSALIKNSFTAELLFDENFQLFAPEFLFSELKKYEKAILEKTNRSESNYIEILNSLNEIITIIPLEEFSEYLDEAEKVSPDFNDVMYFALAMKLKCGLWSNDKKLKEQDKVKVYSTDEVRKMIS